MCALSIFVTTLEHRAITLLCSGTEQNPFNPPRGIEFASLEEQLHQKFFLSLKSLDAHHQNLTCNKKESKVQICKKDKGFQDKITEHFNPKK